jgi:RHS repeat-associated protein
VLAERYLSGPGVVNGAVVDQLLARTSSGGTTAWYLTDKLGSVRDIVSASGTELDHVVYDSFGNIVTETDAANGDRFKYAGMEWDAVVGQYYDRARGYDSLTGKFEAQDPMGFGAGDPNLYAYAGDSPVNATDPTGMSGIGDMMRSGMNMLSGIGKDVQMMAMHPAATISGYYEGLGDGAAMLANAATFQMTPLNNYVEGRIAMMGGGYAVANIAANVAVAAIQATVPCGVLANGLRVMAGASDAVGLVNGIASGNGQQVAMSALGLGTLMVGNWCFAEGTLVHMAADPDLREHVLTAGPTWPDGRTDSATRPSRVALGALCIAIGVGLYLSRRQAPVTERGLDEDQSGRPQPDPQGGDPVGFPRGPLRLRGRKRLGAPRALVC